MPEYDSEKGKMLERLSSIHREQFNERRKIESKLVFTILAFYLGIISTRLTQEIIGKTILDNNELNLLFGIFSVITFVAICYLASIHKANHKNKLIAEKAEKAIVQMLAGKDPDLNIFPPPNICMFEIIKKGLNLILTGDVKKIFIYVLIKDEWRRWRKWSWAWQTTFMVGMAISAALIFKIS
jgi:hypothetical protein